MRQPPFFHFRRAVFVIMLFCFYCSQLSTLQDTISSYSVRLSDIYASVRGDDDPLWACVARFQGQHPGGVAREEWDTFVSSIRQYPQTAASVAAALKAIALVGASSTAHGLWAGLSVYDWVLEAGLHHRDDPSVCAQFCNVLSSFIVENGVLTHVWKVDKCIPAIELALSMMSAHLTHAQVQTAGCSVIRALSFRTGVSVHRPMVTAVNAVLAAMNAHVGAASVQEACAVAIASLSPPVCQVSELRPKFLDVTSGIVRAITLHVTHASVLSACGQALVNLFQCGQAGVSDSDGEAAELCTVAITFAMRNNCRNPKVQSRFCAVMLELCSFGSLDEHLDAVGAAVMQDLIAILCLPLDSTNEECQYLACLCCSTLCASSSHANIRLFVELGGVSSLLQVMSGRRSLSGIQRSCLLILQHVCRSSSEMNSAVVQSGGIACVVDALRAFPADDVVFVRGCAALGSMCAHDDVNRVQVVAEGGFDAALCSLTLLTSLPSTNSCCERFATMVFAMSANSEVVSVLVEKGAIPVLLACMNMESDPECSDLEVMLSCCDALQNIAFVKKYPDLLVREGCLTCVFAMMHRFENVPEAQRACCSVLENLVYHSSDTKALVAKGGMQAILAAIDRLGHDVDVAVDCVSLLSSLLRNRQVALEFLEEGGAHRLVSLFALHPNHVEFNRRVCGILSNISIGQHPGFDVSRVSGVAGVLDCLQRLRHENVVLEAGFVALCGLLYSPQYFDRIRNQVTGRLPSEAEPGSEVFTEICGSVQQVLTHPDLLEVVFTCIASHTTETPLRVSAFGLAINLSIHDPAFAWMQRFADTKQLVPFFVEHWDGCIELFGLEGTIETVWYLAIRPELTAQLVSLNVVDLIKKGLAELPDNADCARHACLAMALVAKHVKQGLEAVLPIASSVATRFPDCSDIQVLHEFLAKSVSS
jgi:hypothetical protein